MIILFDINFTICFYSTKLSWKIYSKEIMKLFQDLSKSKNVHWSTTKLGISLTVQQLRNAGGDFTASLR